MLCACAAVQVSCYGCSAVTAGYTMISHSMSAIAAEEYLLRPILVHWYSQRPRRKTRAFTSALHIMPWELHCRRKSTYGKQVRHSLLDSISRICLCILAIFAHAQRGLRTTPQPRVHPTDPTRYSRVGSGRYILPRVGSVHIVTGRNP